MATDSDSEAEPDSTAESGSGAGSESAIASETVSRLSEALATQDVDCDVVTAPDLPAHLDRVVDGPAVGVACPFAPDALDAAGVETNPTPAALREASTGVTPVEFAIASYGSLAIPQTAAGHEPVSLYPETHVAIVPESEVYPDLAAGFERLAELVDDGTDSVVFATGPSATADMGELIEGVHGPSEVRVLVVTDR